MKQKEEKKKSVPNGQRYGVSIDCGTGFVVGASFNSSNEMNFKSIRDAFYNIPKNLFNKNLFNKNQIKYIELGDDVIVVGDEAVNLALIQGSRAQRPLAEGVLNVREKSAAPILREIFRFCVQDFKKKDNEKLVFSIPGPMIGKDNFNITYHEMSIKSLVQQFGFDAIPMNEAFLVSVSELGHTTDMTALSFSFGAGMCNVCFSYRGMNLFNFSTDKSGDFIDQQSAQSCGESESKMQYIKEHSLDLNSDEFSVSAEERALIYTYRHVIQYTIGEVKKAFSKSSVNIIEEVPIIISGGTSLVPGFINSFETECKTAKLPFKYNKIVHAKDPLKAVAAGGLIYANSLEDDEIQNF